MDLYTVSLATGAVGLGVMAVGGFSHGTSHGSAGHAGAQVGHGHTGGHLAQAGTVGHAAHAGHAAHHGEHGSSSGWSLSSLLSPRLLFALMVGFGAGGIAAAPLGEPFQFVVALAAAVAFEMLAVGPLWRFLFRFESRSATTLESSIEDEARAVTAFDADGCGLVALDVDGQVVQLLATLDPDERSRGVRIRSGDIVRVAEVDAARGRCTVTARTR
jgi:hypothetical protein